MSLLGFRVGKFKDVFWDVTLSNVLEKHQDLERIILPSRMRLARDLCSYLSNYSKSHPRKRK